MGDGDGWGWGLVPELVGKRLSVGIPVVVGVLSVVTGIAHIGIAPVAGPLDPFLPVEVRRAAGFTGTVTGFVLLLGAYGMRRGLRGGWYVSIVLLPVTAAQGLIQSSPFSLPLVVLSVVAIPVLVVNRGHFRERVSLTAAQTGAAGAIAAVFAYGTIGSYALREEFDGITSVLDAFYFTVVTASTVGYGDITGETQFARLFALSVVFLGTASFALAVGALLAPAIEARLAGVLGRQDVRRFELLEDHVVLLGAGELSEAIIMGIPRGTPHLVVTPDAERARALQDRGVVVLTGDPGDEAVLEQAQVGDARVVVAATEGDAADAFTVLAVGQYRPELRVVAAATEPENIENLRRAGADAVVCPEDVAAAQLVRAAGVLDGGGGVADTDAAG